MDKEKILEDMHKLLLGFKTIEPHIVMDWLEQVLNSLSDGEDEEIAKMRQFLMHHCICPECGKHSHGHYTTDNDETFFQCWYCNYELETKAEPLPAPPEECVHCKGTRKLYLNHLAIDCPDCKEDN